MYIYISSCWNWKRTGNDVPWKKNKHYDVCFSDQYKKNDFTNRRYILQNMEKSLGEFFTILNLDCIFYSLTILPDSHVDIKWDRLAPQDYETPPTGTNRINLRIHKTTDQKSRQYFLDAYQHFGALEWRGFRFGRCTHYEVKTSCVDEPWFDAIFYFDNGEQLIIRHINNHVFLVLQDFFTGFLFI